jgi:hypothetical protein
VCTQGGKIGNLEKVGGYLQEIFLQGVSQNIPTLQGGIDLFTLITITITITRIKNDNFLDAKGS